MFSLLNWSSSLIDWLIFCKSFKNLGGFAQILIGFKTWKCNLKKYHWILFCENWKFCAQNYANFFVSIVSKLRTRVIFRRYLRSPQKHKNQPYLYKKLYQNCCDHTKILTKNFPLKNKKIKIPTYTQFFEENSIITLFNIQLTLQILAQQSSNT